MVTLDLARWPIGRVMVHAIGRRVAGKHTSCCRGNDSDLYSGSSWFDPPPGHIILMRCVVAGFSPSRQLPVQIPYTGHNHF